MITWKVQWVKPEGGKAYKKFPGRKPKESGAVEFFKKLKHDGLNPVIICSNHAWPITAKQEEKRRPGLVWCPYCVRWRKFKLMKVKRKNYVTEAFMRCPVCTISTNDFFVKKFNGFLEHMTEIDVIKKLTKYEETSARE